MELKQNQRMKAGKMLLPTENISKSDKKNLIPGRKNIVQSQAELSEFIFQSKHVNLNR